MNAERWQEVEEVLQGALDRPVGERASFLDEACAGDEGLREEAFALLSAHDDAGDFIELPAMARDARVLFGDGMEANVGRTVGAYRVVSPLGSGGMGEVYLAQDVRLGRPVALKILHAYYASDDARLRRFQREARSASALNHPNILTIHEVGEAEGRLHFIATEFIDGLTLRELIARRALSLEEILDVALQVASALAAAHAAGIVHRDIKPENIMRRADRLVKILDFGIAKLTEQPAAEFSSEAPTIIKGQTEAGVVMGTAGYMSPEQARGLSVDERSDVWSLGCVLYEMLAGRAPFAGATRIDTLVAVLEREPTPIFNAAAQTHDALVRLEDIVTKALSKERDERYASVTEMLEELKNVEREIASDEGLKDPEALSALRVALDDGGEGISAAATAQNAERRLSASAAADRLAQEAHKRIRRALIAVAIMIVAIVLSFFYSRWAAQRDSNAPGSAPVPAAAAVPRKLYREMTEAEQLAFIDEQEQSISAQMGERPARLGEDALRAIKFGVDDYAKRLGSKKKEYGAEDLRDLYARPVPYLPLIGRSFAERKVPVMVGIYLPMIESEYKPCFSNSFGAKGLFQFLPTTARQYGVSPEEMCDERKMTPAAAHYIADRMAELGDDAESMTLVLLSYNRGPEWVRDTLRRLRETGDYERNFWAFFANRDKLDDTFRNENAGYVPRFFAAAIVGENPQVFGLEQRPLTELAGAPPLQKGSGSK